MGSDCDHWIPETFKYIIFWSSDFIWFNDLFMWSVLCTRPTIWIPDQYIRKQDCIHLLVFKLLGCSVCKLHLNAEPFGIYPFFHHLNTELVWYSDPHCNIIAGRRQIEHYKTRFMVSHNNLYSKTNCSKMSGIKMILDFVHPVFGSRLF